LHILFRSLLEVVEASTSQIGGDVHMTLAPFRGFWDMQSEVGRLFNDMVGDLLGRRRREGFARERLWAPRLEAFAREGDLVIHADLPGVALDDVDITLEGTTLTISGERKLPAAGDGIDLGWSEEDLAEVRRVLRPVVSLENEDLERG
jgi:HSP20 family protein